MALQQGKGIERNKTKPDDELSDMSGPRRRHLTQLGLALPFPLLSERQSSNTS